MSNTNGVSLDEDVKEEIEQAGGEDQLIGGWTNSGGGGDKVPVLTEWIPEGHEWQGKTILNEQEARLLAIARNLPKAYPEIEDMQPFLEGLITDYEMYKTSVDGVSREQQKSVLMAMFGKSPGEEDGLGNMIVGAFGGGGDDDD